MKKLIAFDLDDTLAITKSPISDGMSVLLTALLERFDVCIISGGKFEQFKTQVVDRLETPRHLLNRLHLMPTCGTRYYRYDELVDEWIQQYAEDLTQAQKTQVIEVLTAAAKKLGYWEAKPYGDIIEDRGSQITFSALGQQAPPDEKYKWDPEGIKKHALREYAAPLLPGLEVRAGGSTSIDVTRVGIDKAYGMQKLISTLEISKEDILFFGDKLEEGGNDYPVKAMGIDSLEVSDHRNTEQILTGILHVL